MKKFYISTSQGKSGIAKYAADFFRLVLKDKGYIFIDSQEKISDIMSMVSSKDHVHIEIGIFQKKEIDIFFLMLRANYKSISVTLHDAPLVKYPFRQYNSALLNKASKFYDKYIDHFKSVAPYMKRLKSIYVLSQKGVEAVKKTYGVDNVYYLPHIIDEHEVENNGHAPNNFVYIGFIGRNKGIEYALKLHEAVLRKKPGVDFYLAGIPMGKEKKYYETLKSRFTQNVHYLGYTEEGELQNVIRKANFALMPFRDYKFFWPTSGSVLYSLKKGKIVLTNQVNTIPEIIQHNKNGIFLTGNLKRDTQSLLSIMDDEGRQNEIRTSAYNFIKNKHSANEVAMFFKD